MLAFFLLVAAGAPGRVYGGGRGHGGSHHGGGYWHGDGGHWHGSVFIGPWWWGGPYYSYYPWGYPWYPYPAPYYPYAVPPSYYPSYPSDEPQTYVQQPPAPPAPQAYWYYCPSSRAYYPTVRTCSEQWVRVAPRP